MNRNGGRDRHDGPRWPKNMESGSQVLPVRVHGGSRPLLISLREHPMDCIIDVQSESRSPR